MDQSLKQEPAFERSSFEQSCAYCGARFEVFVSRQAGAEEEERYRCPECAKAYTVEAALPPLVHLVAPRTDGRGAPYQETMF